VSSPIIFDTSIFVDHLRSGRHQERLDLLSGLIRTSAVVLSELWRDTSRPAEKAFLRELEGNHPILTPTEKNWLESGGNCLAACRRTVVFHLTNCEIYTLMC
jgi:predicted nucleic acid-binding protein